jgi:hypothetical protein
MKSRMRPGWAKTAFSLFIFLACVGVAWSQAPREAEATPAPKPNVPAFGVGLRLSMGFGGLFHDSSIVLPIYKSGQTYLLGLGLNFKYHLGGGFFLTFDPAYDFSSYYSVFFVKPDMTSHSVLLPAGVEFMLSEDNAIIGGVIANYQVSGTLNAAQGIANTSPTINLTNKDLGQPGWGGYAGVRHRASKLVTLQFTLEYYRAVIRSDIIAGRFGIIFGF